MLADVDRRLMMPGDRADLSGVARFVTEFWYFGIKKARACLFAGVFFAAVFLIPRQCLFGIARYNLLLLFAVAVQCWMVRSGIETLDELKAISIFHVIGFAPKVFKTYDHIQPWSYPDPTCSKLFGVPLFSGFMYAAAGSDIIQAWGLFHLRIVHPPPYWMATLIAVLIYLNFFTHHYIGDYRWYLGAAAQGLYARATVVYRPFDRDRKMPLLLAFLLIGFFIWLAENISTFFGIWRYPNQIGAWSTVHLGKWSAWALLVVMTFTIVAQLKHIRPRIHIAP